jgi:hypothetical protein
MTDYQKSSKNEPEGEPKPDKPRPEVQKIVTSEVVIPKKSLGSKFMDTFFDGDFFKGLVHHVYRDVIVPNAKHIMFDTGLELLKGGVYRNGNARRVLDPQNLVSRITNYQTPPNRTGYPSSGWPMNQNPGLPPPGMPAPLAIELTPRRMGRSGPRVYQISDRREAEGVLKAMTEIIGSEYKVVSIAEVHQMLGLEFSPVDNDWGWFSVADARIVANRDGYTLELPQPEVL